MPQQQAGRMEAHQESHGHSLASWVLVGFLLVSAFVVSLAIVLQLVWLTIVGVAVGVVGLVLGRLLQMAGFGVHRPVADDGADHG
jgi:hypothetical protein